MLPKEIVDWNKVSSSFANSLLTKKQYNLFSILHPFCSSNEKGGQKSTYGRVPPAFEYYTQVELSILASVQQVFTCYYL